MDGSAVFSGRSALVSGRVLRTATSGRRTANRSARPSSRATGATQASDVLDGMVAPNMGRAITGCGVGIDALASPIWAQAITPPLTTTDGRTPKNAGSHKHRSASLPTSTEPTSPSSPWDTAGQMVTLAM